MGFISLFSMSDGAEIRNPKGLPQRWVHFNQPSHADMTRTASLKTNSEAIKQLSSAIKDPLAYSNDIQKIYYIRCNPAALKSPLENNLRVMSTIAFRYATAAGLWVGVGAVGAYYLLRPNLANGWKATKEFIGLA